MSTERVVEWLCREEGFKSKPYFCSEGVITFGHGLTYITKEESLMIMKNRIKDCSEFIDGLLQERNISIDDFRRDVLIDMCYQLGFKGITNFKRMWNALKRMEYYEASEEMKDSLWHQQTPVRCKLLADRMANGC